MKAQNILIFLLLIYCVVGQSYITLSYSGKQETKLISPLGTNKNFVYSTSTTPRIPQVPLAKSFWLGPGNVIDCPMSITFQDKIDITCLRQPVILYIRVDNKFNATFLGSNMSGNDYRVVFNFTLDPSTFVCNGSYVFAITATNNKNSNATACENGNAASVAYGVLQLQTNGCCEIDQYYSRLTCECYSCTLITPYCKTCLDQITCTSCFLGYNLLQNFCVPVCGNSIRTQHQQCDDGNTQSYDGCSSDCKIEDNFNCSVFIQEQSKCIFSSQFKIYVKQVFKKQYQNYVTISLGIYPNIPKLKNINFFKAFSQINCMFIDECVYFENGNILLSYYYNQSKQNYIEQLIFMPKIIGNQFQNFTQIPINVTMKTNQNIPIFHYSQSIYNCAKSVELWFFILVLFSIFILLISFILNKIIGLQLFKVFQICFYSLSTINNVHPLLTPIFEYKSLNGFNFWNRQTFGRVPDRINAIHSSSQIVQNINVSIGLAYFLLFSSVLLRILKGLLGKSKISSTMVSRNIIKQNLLFWILFISTHIGFSTGIFIHYSSIYLPNIIMFILSIAIVIFVYVLLTFSKKQDYAQFTESIKSNKQNQLYFRINLLFNFTIGLLMSLLNQTYLVSFLVFGLSFSLLIFHASIRPFKQTFQNYRCILNDFTTSFILFTRMLYNNFNQNHSLNIEQWILATSLIEMILLSLCVIISIICLVYLGYCKFRKVKPNKILEYILYSQQSQKQISLIKMNVPKAELAEIQS